MRSHQQPNQQNSTLIVSLPANCHDRVRQDLDQNKFFEPEPDALAQFERHTAAFEELECTISSREFRCERTIRGVRSLEHAQILEAFDALKLAYDGKVSKSVVDQYIKSAGIKPSRNNRIASSGLLRACVATAQRRKGAAPSKRSKSRICAYSSAIDYAVLTQMPRDEFEQHLRGERSNGKRQGIYYLAELGRELRRRSVPRSNIHTQLDEVLAALDLRADEDGFLRIKRIGPHYEIVDCKKRPRPTNDSSNANSSESDASLRGAGIRIHDSGASANDPDLEGANG